MTVHTLPQLDPDARRRRGRLQMLAVVLVCAAPVIASYFTFYVLKPGEGTAAYGNLVEPRKMPAVNAVGLDGQAQPLRDLAGQWLMVVVDSGRCDADCESRLFMQRQLREMTGRERDRIDKLWLVLDDAPVSATLRAALSTTPAMHVRRLPREVVAQWLSPAPGERLEDGLYMVDPLGQWMMRWPAKAEPARVKRDLDRLLRASAGWDRAGRQALLDAPAARSSAPPAGDAAAAGVPTSPAASR